MLIETITFEIRNFKNGTSEEFIVENNEINFELIAANRFTRDIKFTQTFSFQFAHNRRVPAFIDDYYEAAIDAAIEEFIETHREEYMIDDVDEMVGTY